MTNKRKIKGFTIIELMIVIAIIGLLASIVVISLIFVRGKAQDAHRYSDLHQIELALAMYHNDHDSYPSTGLTPTAGITPPFWTVCHTGHANGDHDTTGSNGYIPDLAPDYIHELPTDPKGCSGSGTYKGYIYYSDGKDYKFAGDWTAFEGSECGPGKRFADQGPPLGTKRSEVSNHTFCSISSPGGALW